VRQSQVYEKEGVTHRQVPDPLGNSRDFMKSFAWSRLFADQAAVAITNAQVFEELKITEAAQGSACAKLLDLVTIKSLKIDNRRFQPT
jgi:hypothetical protein